MKLIQILLLCSIFINLTVSQQNGFSISNSVNLFTVDLLSATIKEAVNDENIALSPLTVWTLLTVVAEGAENNTVQELERVLYLPKNKQPVRSSFSNLTSILTQNRNGINMEICTAIFTNQQYKLKEMFQTNSKQFYKVDVTPVNFDNIVEASNTINNYVSRLTKNRIPSIVHGDDLSNAQIFLSTVLYFYGQWQKPFNKSATKMENFYNDKNTKIGEVEMMFQTGFFPFSRIKEIRAYAVELPYGDGDMAMIVLLPFKGNSVANVLNLLTKQTLNIVFEALGNAEAMFVDEDIQVYIPKFTIKSDLLLNVVLKKMGLLDVFDREKAELLGILNHYLFVTRLLQKAEIEVNEEGTTATAAAGVSFNYKTPPPKFQANNPFLYFIVDKRTKTVVFAGKFSKPKNNLLNQ